VTIAVRGNPHSETELFALAWGNAQGLLAGAYENACEAQKWEWIDMCENALREAIESLALE
jgi:hypothetical protein